MTTGSSFSARVPGDESLVRRRPIQGEARFDMTAMVDLVFMMNIFFLITAVGAALAEIDLPSARHVVAADRDSSVVLTLLAAGDRGAGLLHIGDGQAGEPLSDVQLQERAVREAVEAGVREHKNTVIIKAEKKVRVRDVARIAAVAMGVRGTELRLAVMEKE